MATKYNATQEKTRHLRNQGTNAPPIIQLLFRFSLLTEHIISSKIPPGGFTINAGGIKSNFATCFPGRETSVKPRASSAIALSYFTPKSWTI
jgi:hypothetical protein